MGKVLEAFIKRRMASVGSYGMTDCPFPFYLQSSTTTDKVRIGYDKTVQGLSTSLTEDEQGISAYTSLYDSKLSVKSIIKLGSTNSDSVNNIVEHLAAQYYMVQLGKNLEKVIPKLKPIVIPKKQIAWGYKTQMEELNISIVLGESWSSPPMLRVSGLNSIEIPVGRRFEQEAWLDFLAQAQDDVLHRKGLSKGIYRDNSQVLKLTGLYAAKGIRVQNRSDLTTGKKALEIIEEGYVIEVTRSNDTWQYAVKPNNLDCPVLGKDKLLSLSKFLAELAMTPNELIEENLTQEKPTEQCSFEVELD